MEDEIPKFSMREYLETRHNVYSIYRDTGYSKIRCPFHDDSEASASVNLDSNYFKCFGCDVSGDVIDLIMLEEGVDFATALESAKGIASEDRQHVSGSTDAGDYGFRLFS